MTLIAHVSDLHLGPVPFPASRPLGLKPALGWINWARQPGQHDNALWREVAERITAAKPDFTMVTGDLIELGLASEWQAAAAALQRLGPPATISWAPGNHDFYTGAAVARARDLMAPYLPAGGNGDIRDRFPRLDLVGRAAIVTLCSGTPTWLFSAEGELGAGQLARLDAMLARLDRREHCPVIAVHHPAVAPSLSRLKRLRDGEALADLLIRRECSLLFHGHLHQAVAGEVTRGGRTLTQIGAPSASATGRGGDSPAGFNLVRISEQETGLRWSLERVTLR
ncbi:MAG: metallophosphoesterase [Piscinibacter sp.]